MPFGYARLNISIALSTVLVGSVLIYQSYVHRQITSGQALNAPAAVPTYVQLYPQTIPSLTKGLYELVVEDKNGQGHSLGTFSVQGTEHRVVDANGQAIANGLFPLPAGVSDLTKAGIYIRDTASSERVPFMAGAFSGDRSHLDFIAADIAKVSGSYMLATPTDGDQTLNEISGLWFGDVANSQPGLQLPALPNGWVYEGWAVLADGSLTTGRFVSGNRSDLSAAFSAGGAAPAIPGEDFLRNPPVAVFPSIQFPLDLRGKAVMISVEPDTHGIDPTGAAPFGMTVLRADISKRADTRVPYELKSVVELPKASVVLR